MVKIFLAPLAGYSDPAFRLLCRELGADMVYTELINVHRLSGEDVDIEYCEEERPLALQLFGRDIDAAVDSVDKVNGYFDFIDINLGCPAPKITKQQAGASLLQEPGHMGEYLSKIVSVSDKPVSVKMRTGIDKHDKFMEIGRIAESSGVDMLTLHARTLEQGYSGKADWEQIRKLKENVSIPVTGNGDINRPEDAKRMIDETGCDNVMIGRAAMKNPYIFTQVRDYLEKGTYSPITDRERINLFLTYLEYTKGFNIRYSDIKTHAMNYTKGIEGGAGLRRKISQSKSIEELKSILSS